MYKLTTEKKLQMHPWRIVRVSMQKTFHSLQIIQFRLVPYGLGKFKIKRCYKQFDLSLQQRVEHKAHDLETLLLSEPDRQVVRDRIHQLQDRIESQPKTVRWKMRARVGERVKWYKDVEELMHR